MTTRRLSFDVQGHIETAGQLIRAGGLVAIPTETVYGLAANAMDEGAVRRIFTVKGRPQDNPLIVHVADLAQVGSVCRHVPPAARTLMRAFWPGPLTLVMAKIPEIPSVVTAGLDTAAVRCPEHPVARAIIAMARRPLAAPSANLSGRPSPTTAAHVLADMDGKIEAVVDGGACSVGVESTVVDVTGSVPLVLRQGGVPLEQLRALLPDTELYSPPQDAPPRSPGIRHRHYAPRTPVQLFFGESGDLARLAARLGDSRKLAVLCFDEEREALAGVAGVKALRYGPGADAAGLAAGLFAALREADDYGAELLLVHAPEGEGLFATVRDRLQRAAETDGR